MLALLLRSSVAVALAGAPTVSPTSDPVSPQSREYAGAEASESVVAEPPSEAVAAGTPEAAAVVPPPPAVPSPSTPVITAQPEPTPAPEGPSEDEAIDEIPYDPLIDSPEAIRARHWVRSGAVFLALGAVLTIGAIAMSQAKVNVPETGEMNCNNRGDPAGNGCTKGGRTRATAALAVPGALLLGGGVAMLTVGKLQQRRLAASVRADRQSFALGLSWRF
jgi:hypothetical protein